MKPIMFILAKIFGKKEIGTHIIMYYWRKIYWIWKCANYIYACRECDRLINQREYEARDGVCQRCWGQIGDVK